MSLTSMTGSCRLLCYRTPVEVEWLPITRERYERYYYCYYIIITWKIYMNDNWRPDGMVLWTGLGLAFERGSDCTCSACVDWGSFVAVDGSQVIDLLSWAHTCLWERKGSLHSCRGFRLFPNLLIGGGKCGGLSTILRPDLKCGGLESKFGWGPRPCDMSGMGWSYLCLGYKWGVCFGVPSWDTLVHESPCS